MRKTEMELKELYDNILKLFQADSAATLGSALLTACDDEKKLDEFVDLVGGDLSKDWLQMIFQYYLADRKEKKQDYTPASVSAFMAMLAGTPEVLHDMCAGTGALTIQAWNIQPDRSFILYECDKNVIPFLLFNLVVRNIRAIVNVGDVLSGISKAEYRTEKGERYGKVISNIQSSL